MLTTLFSHTSRPLTLLVAVLVTLAAAPTVATADDIPDEYFTLMGRADEAIAAGNYGEAETLLTDAIRLQPGNPSNVLLMSNLGMVRYAMGHDSLAVATLDAAHAMAPRSTVVLRNRAKVLTALERLDSAAADYTRLIALDSTAIEPRFRRGMIRLRRGDIDAARIDFDSLKIMAPDTLETHLGNAMLSMAEGDYAKGAIEFTGVLRHERQPEYYAQRALCFLLTNRPGDAADDIAAGLELDPLDPELYLLRAMANKARYRSKDAEADIKKAVELGADPQRAALLLR